MFPICRPAGAGLLVAVLIVFTGCGGSVVKPRGKVTLKGQPAAGAELVLQPGANPDAPVAGIAGADGVYTLDYAGKGGVPVGKCRVVVTHYTLRNGKPLPEGEEGAALKANETKVVKNVYVFEKEIATEPGELNFELSEGKKVEE